MIIRRARPEDLNVIFEFICFLEESRLEYAAFREGFIYNLQQRGNYYLIAEMEGVLIGFLSCHGQFLLHHAAVVCEIQELFVDEDFRGIGTGRKLLNELEKLIKADGCQYLEVTSNIRRTEAHRFYLANGFDDSHRKFTKTLF